MSKTPPIPEAVPAGNTPSGGVRKYGTVKVHWYMAALEVYYIAYVTNPEAPDDNKIPVRREQRMNAIVQSQGRNIVAKTLEDIRSLCFMRMEEQYGVKPENMSDYIILNMMHMGHMTEQEHFTKYQPKDDVLPHQKGR